VQKNFSKRKLYFSVCVQGAVHGSVWRLGRCLLSLCGAVLHDLWCVSTYFVVRFNSVAMTSWYVRSVALRQKKFQKKKAPSPLTFFYQCCRCGQVGTVVLEHVNAVCLCVW